MSNIGLLDIWGTVSKMSHVKTSQSYMVLSMTGLWRGGGGVGLFFMYVTYWMNSKKINK